MKLNLTLAIATLFVASTTLSAQPRQHEQKFIEGYEVEGWYTTNDRSMLTEKTDRRMGFTWNNMGKQGAIIVDPRQTYQEVVGFGFAMTGGSAMHLINMTPEARHKILVEMFGKGPENAGFSHIRLTLGASDMNAFVFSYDDMPEGKEDFNLKHFSLSQDLNDVVPVMKEVLEINPDIDIFASPWSAPAWMKTSGDVRGGKLRKECYDVYARYFVKYIQAMDKQGIHIKAVTVQNEPLNNRNTPSMPWTPDEQTDFIKNYLGPQFEKAGLKTDIFLFDHNCDRPDYPLAILNDPEAAKYASGSAFHHYAGDMSAMTMVHNCRPDKDIYFSEQMTTERPGSATIDIAPAVERTVVNVMRNWSRNVILWNLANDPNNDPHTDNGGCSMCQGAITIDGDEVTRNIGYYAIRQVSALVPSGSVRIASTSPTDPSYGIYEDEQAPGTYRMVPTHVSGVMPNVAFETPDGKIVLVVVNNSYRSNFAKVQYKGMFANLYVDPASVATFVWNK